jgi:Domain of unknown function (DUF1918)
MAGGDMVEVGSRILVESEKVGTPSREGVVLAVQGDRVKVRWDNEQETTFLPAAGSLRVVSDPRDQAGD